MAKVGAGVEVMTLQTKVVNANDLLPGTCSEKS